MTLKEQLAYLTKGAEETIRAEDLHTRLERSAKTGIPLRVKAGFDPTAPDIHLGHTVLLRKLKHFQDLGHTVIFLIGDFTGLIGDPSGRNVTRPPMTPEEIAANAETYKKQVFKILDPEKTLVEFNNRWLGKLNSQEWMTLLSKYTVARLLERDDFSKRFKEGRPITLLELVYPLAMAYDSVALKADVELGGTDQKFNLLAGRAIQQEYGQEPQVIMMMPILEGLDGVQKMSKSLGNYVGISEPPQEMFGKLMSISDDLMWRYYDLLTDLPPAEIAGLKKSVSDGATHPLDMKKGLARRIVGDFHGAVAADQAQKNWETQFQKKSIPDEVRTESLSHFVPIKLTTFLATYGLASSKTEVTRKIKEGAVSITVGDSDQPSWERISDPAWEFDPAKYSDHGSVTFRVGRKLLKVVIKP
ncbi:MAG: tyrosine--tRNA ligase [Acidobacteria bacterium]|nr:MAG: tyrosine--tRNA ligase [Acidobacteriota bacterium]